MTPDAIRKRAAREKAAAARTAPAGSGAAGKVPGYTGRDGKTISPAELDKMKMDYMNKIGVDESLSWSKGWDPSQLLIKKIR
jgi:hypothetical protein